MTDSPMTNYDMDLIRHIVGKALVESDEIDIESFDTEAIETALWAAKGEISYGMYMNHPEEKKVYEHRKESELEDSDG